MREDSEDGTSGPNVAPAPSADSAAGVSSAVAATTTATETETAAPLPPRIAANISDLAPLYEVFGPTLGVLNHQVINDQRHELEEMKQMIHELRKVKITGVGGSPIYAHGLVDEHGYEYKSTTSPEIDGRWWYVRMMEFPTQPVPIEAINNLEVWLGGILLSRSDRQTQASFDGNTFLLDFSSEIELWFDVSCGHKSLPASMEPGDNMSLNEWFFLQFDGETISFGEVCIGLGLIRQFLSTVCKKSTLDDANLAQQRYELYGIAEDAVAQDYHPKPEGGYKEREYRNMSPTAMAEFGRRFILVTDGLILMGFKDGDDSAKAAAETLAKIAGETDSKSIFLDHVRTEMEIKEEHNKTGEEISIVGTCLRSVL